MARTKISTIAKELNIAMATAVEFLRKKDINVDENPNTRIDDDVVELLKSEFKNDRTLKGLADEVITRAPKKNVPAKTENADAHEQVQAAPAAQRGPKILGKIDLDNHGNPVAAKPEEAKKVDAEVVIPETQQVKKEEPSVAETPVKEPVKAETPRQEPQKAETPKEEKKPEPVESANSKVSAQENKTDNIVEKPKKEPAETEPAPQPAAPAKQENEEEVFTLKSEKTAGPSLNIVGKIDLSSINASTRPKKKTKEERRNANKGTQPNGAGQQQGNAASAGDRKKRKRIGGKEKVDIEKAGAQVTRENADRKKNNDQRRDKGGKNNDRQKQRPIHPEVNEEDVQRQVKETLARLTSKDKGQKKGVKWRKEKREAASNREREAAEMAAEESKVLKLTEFVTANDLASMMDIPVTQVIATCMNIGVMVSINQRLDAETINIVAEEFGYTTEYVSAEVSEAIANEEDSEEDLQARPPIVTVMGHVDHGKTSLLDYIRNANVIAGEAGGITQHIGAYNVRLSDGRHITFLDTPGHEAFTAMRARGAKVTDICIIIVAADDNVMPQTVEAINHASAAGVPIVFAINKIDKPTANPDKIKEELAAMNYLVEEWGGKYQSQDISAKKGIGVEDLLEKVLLEAEMLDLRANPDRNATGSIIESSLDKGRGYVATVLVQNGTLKVGDIILAGTHFGKIKAMFNERNQRIKQAGPAEPALILGLNGAPTAGDTFNVMDTEQEAREIATKREQLQRELGLRTNKRLTLEDIGRRRAIGNFQELNVIVKGDVDGSIEALSDSLIKLSTEEIQVNVIHKAVGEISESDVTLAAASDAIIIGFQVRPSVAARRDAEREGVQIRLYSVIYQAIEEVKDAMAGMLAPEIKEEVVGTAEVLETYHISKVGTIAGAIVRDGKIKRSCKVRLIRDGIVKYTGDLGSLKRFKDDVKEVLNGYDCGLSIAGYNDLKVGDFIEAYEEVEVNRTL